MPHDAEAAPPVRRGRHARVRGLHRVWVTLQLNPPHLAPRRLRIWRVVNCGLASPPSDVKARTAAQSGGSTVPDRCVGRPRPGHAAARGSVRRRQPHADASGGDSESTLHPSPGTGRGTSRPAYNGSASEPRDERVHRGYGDAARAPKAQRVGCVRNGLGELPRVGVCSVGRARVFRVSEGQIIVAPGLV